MRRSLAVFLAGLVTVLAGLSAEARADIAITPKHLIILRQGLDAVYGSYVFAVQNTDTQPAHFKAKVMLPKEMDDFVPQEGVEPDELSLAPEGGVVIEKDFAGGVQIVSIGFKVNASYGRGVLTLTPGTDIQSFTLLVPRQSGLHVSSPVLTSGELGAAPDPQYEAFVSSTALTAGTPFVVEVSGLPEGRKRIWIVGAVVAGLLVVLAGFLSIRTRPKITGSAGETVLVG